MWEVSRKGVKGTHLVFLNIKYMRQHVAPVSLISSAPDSDVESQTFEPHRKWQTFLHFLVG